MTFTRSVPVGYGVFLSYSWSNSAARSALTCAIQAMPNVRLLVDSDLIHPDPVHEVVLRMIDEADCVVVLLTEQGLQSREVLDELARSHDRGKLIIPVVEEGVSLEHLPWFVQDLRVIPYNDRNFDHVKDTIVSTIQRRADPLAGVDAAAIPARLRTLLIKGHGSSTPDRARISDCPCAQAAPSLSSASCACARQARPRSFGSTRSSK